MDQEGEDACLVLQGHAKEIYAVEWCHVEAFGWILATASFDATVRLWDSKNGSCLSILTGNQDAVLTMSFNAGLLATAGLDQAIRIWSLAEPSFPLKSTHEHHSGGVFDLEWQGDKLAACTSDGRILILIN